MFKYLSLRRMIFSTFSAFLFFSTVLSLEFEEKAKPAPDFTLKKIDGSGTVSLSKLRGTVVLVDFWASWCPPCKKSLPYLSKLESKYKNFKVIAINIDDDTSNARAFLNENKLDLTTVYDRDKSVVSAYNVPVMPTAYLIGQTI